MCTGSPDSDENTVSDGAILSRTTSTDSLADLPASSEADDHEPRDQRDDDDDDGRRYTLNPHPCTDDSIRQQVRIGHLALTIASQDVAFLNFEGKPEMTMQELLSEMQDQFHEGERTDDADALGQLFGEICYLLLGTTRMQACFSRRCRLVWK